MSALTVPQSPCAYLWGEDAWAIERAAKELAVALGMPGPPLEIWRAPGEDEAVEDSASGNAAKRRQRRLDEIAARVGMATLFGGGTMVVVRQPRGMIRETAARERLVGLIASVAPGNGLCFTDLVDGDARAPAGAAVLRDAIGAAGGAVREFPALTRNRMEAWLGTRAAELGVTLGAGAARLLAERVGAYVREGDVDRRRMSELANGELEKLALFRPDATISRSDVEELVAEAIPGSTWAFLDAVAGRRSREAARLAERLLAAGTPLPVLITQIHRRLRDLLLVREHVEAGTRPSDLVREMRLAPFRAQKLTDEARAWTLTALDAALEGLLRLDLRSKGISLDGSTPHMSESRDALGVQLWIAEHAVRR